MNEGQLLDAVLRGEAHALAAARSAAAERAAEPQKAPVVYFEPRMRDRAGHFAVLAEAYQALAQRAGTSMSVVHHAAWEGPSPPGWRGALPLADHAVGASRPVSGPGLAAYTDYYRHAVESWTRGAGARLAVFPTARFLTLPAIAASLGASRELAGLIVGIMETFPVPDCEDEQLVTAAFRAAAAALARSGKPALIVAESRPVADWLLAQGFDPGRLLVAPYPAAGRLAPASDAGLARRAPRLGALGATRPVHRPGLLASYLLGGRRRPGTWRIRLDLDLAASELGQGRDALGRALEDRRIELLPPQLEQAAYDETLRSLDVMLLPYGDRYRTIGSGIFLECLCAGVIPLVPRGSTMRGLYEALGGAAPAIEQMSPEGLAAAVDRAVDELARLRDNALLVRDRWLRHPQGPGAWARRLEAFIRSMPGL